MINAVPPSFQARRKEKNQVPAAEMRSPPRRLGVGPADPPTPFQLPVLSESPRSALSIANADVPGPAHQLLEPQSPQQEEPPAMAPASRQDLLAKEHFAFVFGNVKTQNYNDPAAKAPGSHT